MHAVAQLAIKHGVAIGAHPAYPDRKNFGRKPMQISTRALQTSLKEQILEMQAVVTALGGQLHHFKPHGALYSEAAVDLRLAKLIAGVIVDIDSGLMFYGLAASAMQTAAADAGLHFIAEGFIDRAYTAQGLLVPRQKPGAVLTNTSVILAQALALASGVEFDSLGGQKIRPSSQTLCLHGDHPGAPELAVLLSAHLQKNRLQIAAP